MDVYDKIDNLSVNDYKGAIAAIKDSISASELKMLKANISAPNHTITASRLSQVMDFVNFNAANLKYGSFAKKFCNFFNLYPRQYLYILVYFNKMNNEWHWTLKENVISAINELGLIENQYIPNIVNEIEKFKLEQSGIANTTSESIIQSRIGQGLFRAKLIDYWNSCSVTGCQFIDILKASHIKPWRLSNNTERLDVFNGLLLLPNLDNLFDNGYISFDDSGKILISPFVDEKYYNYIGIENSMKLIKTEDNHKNYLQFHREVIFQKQQ